MTNRRTHLQQLAALGLLPLASSWMSMENTIRKRVIPSSQEPLPAVGLGTWQTFDAGDDAGARSPLIEVLKTLTGKGASVVDSSPMYGTSERVVGDLSTELGLNASLFMATKVWTTGKENGIRQMNESLALLKRKQIDLMQVHNLTDWQTHLKTLREWKEQGKVRYVGITHYSENAYASIEKIMTSKTLDFLQINYSMLSRKAEQRLFPIAQEHKIGILVNRPFEEGALFQRVKGKTLPSWATEFDCASWGQFFLKFILSHPAITCVIPGTAKANHMLDNLGAAFGKLPDEKQRVEMVKYIGG